MKEKWQQLSQRERRMLIIMAIAVSISIVYFGMWSPLQNGIEKNRKGVVVKTNQLKSMQKFALEVRQLKGNPRSAQNQVKNSSSLLVTIERTAKLKKLVLQQVKPDGKDGVRLNLEKVSFDQVISWLNHLEKHYGIWVDDISVERETDKGYVNSRILLRISA